MLTEKLVIEMVNTVQIGVVIISSEYNVIYANKYFQEKTGYTQEELKGLGFFNKLVQDPEMNKLLIAKTQSSSEKPFNNLEVNMRRKNGINLTTRINGSSLKDEGELYICFTITDITSEKAYERVIQAGYDNLQQTTIDLDTALTRIKEQQALLTEYKKKMTRELAIATNVQNAIIPAKFISDSKLNIWGAACPSEELGGDYFDFFQLDDDNIGILIADVVGHGVPAALIAAMLKAYFEYYTKHHRKPEDVFAQVNKSMAEMLEDTGLYLTAFYSVLDLKNMEITSTSAGHDPALCFYDNSLEPEKLTTTLNGPILGAFSEAVYESTVAKLKHGSRLVFFTDGITEAKNENSEFFGTENFIQFINENLQLSPKETIEGILKNTDQFCGNKRPSDDRTLIIIDILPQKKAYPTLVQARELINNKDYESAAEALSTILAEDDTQIEAYILSGNVSILQGKYKEAEHILSQAIMLDKAAYKGYYYMGITYYQQKRYDAARDCWLEVKKLFGNYKNTEKFLEKLEK